MEEEKIGIEKVIYHTKLSKRLVQMGGLTQKDASFIIHLVSEAIRKAILEGESISLPDLGTFKLRKIYSCRRYNPKTKESFIAKPGMKLVFRPTMELKQYLRKIEYV